MEIELVFDQSRYTAERLRRSRWNMASGMALVVGVLFLTLGWRSAIIVATVLPVVTLASVATLNALGVPIHQMSVTGLIVALGLLVDAAIVMTDEVGKRVCGRHGAAQAVAGAGAPPLHAAPCLDRHDDPVLPAAPPAARAPRATSWAPSRSPSS
jgi:multidrug efflux pump subunit AcrB